MHSSGHFVKTVDDVGGVDWKDTEERREEEDWRVSGRRDQEALAEFCCGTDNRTKYPRIDARHCKNKYMQLWKAQLKLLEYLC